MPRECISHHAACACREERFRRMEEALKFYADPPKDQLCPDFYEELEWGERAREALKE